MPEGFIARLARGFGYAVKGGDAQAWFGPQTPLAPVAPPEVAGRQFDYPFGFNQVITPRHREPTGFGELRGLADSYDLLRVVLETRKDQMERLSWRIRRRDGVANGATSDRRIATISTFFARPDRVHSWSTWLRILLEDLLVIDAPTLYLRRTRSGALWALEPLDGATIKRLIDDWGRTPAPPTPAYQQILKGVPAVDYTADELIYAPRNLRRSRTISCSPIQAVQPLHRSQPAFRRLSTPRSAIREAPFWCANPAGGGSSAPVRAAKCRYRMAPISPWGHPRSAPGPSIKRR